MTVSNEERREVAQRMRHEITFMRINREWYESEDDAVECGNRAFRDIAHSAIPYSNIHCDYITIVERLADLIDRPTTHVDVNKHGRACCANCGCDDRCLADDSAHFCPQCGAEVAR